MSVLLTPNVLCRLQRVFDGNKAGNGVTHLSKNEVLARVCTRPFVLTDMKGARAGTLKDRLLETHSSTHLVPSDITQPLQHLLLFCSLLLQLSNLSLLLLNIAIHVRQLLKFAQSFADFGLDGDHLVW